ncbi:MAG: RNA methyltransferase [Anaerolineae bacterium]|nr:RNA methyltransferase [Anaerolineae bacterium]MDW8298375.1 RNA methyltransferase [Anaerolineae bacterium]
MSDLLITSLHNPRVKLVRALQTQSKARRAEKRLVLEGTRLIADALAADVQPDFILYSESFAHNPSTSQLLTQLRALDVPCIAVTEAVMAHMAQTQAPQGILAVVPLPELPFPSSPTLLLALDGVSEAGNLGTLLRSAAAAGADGVLMLPNCVDPFNPKALRSGMGAHFRLPLKHSTWQQIAADFPNLPFYLADASATVPYYTVNWRHPAALIIGGEAHGATDAARRHASQAISIPMANATESLNAAVAAAVILFEARRQRTLA